MRPKNVELRKHTKNQGTAMTIGTARIVSCCAGSMKRRGVRPSVCLSWPARAYSSKSAAAGLLLGAADLLLRARRAGDIERLL